MSIVLPKMGQVQIADGGAEKTYTVRHEFDGTLVNETTGAVCKPPGQMEWVTSHYTSATELRLNVPARTLDMVFINDLTETLLFFNEMNQRVVVMFS